MRINSVEMASAGIMGSGPRVWANRTLNGVSIALPIVGFISGMALQTEQRMSVGSLLLLGALLPLSALGITLGLHRLFAHRAYTAHPALRVVLGVLGTWAFQGPIERWVADHRRHHRFTDQAWDPHSPWVSAAGTIRNRFAGFLHAHFLWMLTGDYSDPSRYAPEIRADPLARWFTQYYWPVAISGLLLPAVLGAVLGGPAEALRCFTWAGCFRVMVTHQLTWAVNSFGHMVGQRDPEARHQARNNRLLALLLLGEGLHAWHHAHPRSGIKEPRNLDITGAVLRALGRVGLATVPPPR